MDAEISFSAAVWDMIWAAWNAARDDDYSYITGKENVKYNKLVLGDPEETSLFSNVSYNNTHNTSNSVFVDYAEGKGSLHHMFRRLKRIYPEIKNAGQICQSVITHWLKTHNLREVQYMAGHRWVSSTDR